MMTTYDNKYYASNSDVTVGTFKFPPSILDGNNNVACSHTVTVHPSWIKYTHKIFNPFAFEDQQITKKKFLEANYDSNRWKKGKKGLTCAYK